MDSSVRRWTFAPSGATVKSGVAEWAPWLLLMDGTQATPITHVTVLAATAVQPELRNALMDSSVRRWTFAPSGATVKSGVAEWAPWLLLMDGTQATPITHVTVLAATAVQPDELRGVIVVEGPYRTGCPQQWWSEIVQVCGAAVKSVRKINELHEKPTLLQYCNCYNTTFKECVEQG